MKKKISGVYKILCVVNGKFYIGSSKDVQKRWREHKCPSVWHKCPNNPLYKDMQKYGLDKFRFQILASIMPECLKQAEQDFIDFLKPEYNNIRAKGLDVEQYKETHRKSAKKYQNTEKGKQVHRKYFSQLCSYNGETLKLGALRMRFRKAGIPHATLEARKYLVQDTGVK